MEPTTLSDRSQPRSAAANSSVGMLEWLDDEGQVRRTWRLSQPRCTIGSSSESTLCIEDSSLSAVHALIVFGKNHTLIRALGGQVRVAGRSVREWLIDEPTLIQCGATRCLVYPSGTLHSALHTRHRVAAGSVVDQAARLRSAPTSDSSLSDELSSTSPPVSTPEDSAILNRTAGSSSSVAAEPFGPTIVVAKLDPDDVKTALEPLQLAVQAANDGIIELTRRANESAAQLVDLPPINSNLTEMTHAIETLEDRVSTISNYCENLLANVSESIEGRMSRFEEILTKFSESSGVSASSAAAEHDMHAVQNVPATQDTYDKEQLIQGWYEESRHSDRGFLGPDPVEMEATALAADENAFDDEGEDVPVASAGASYFSEIEDLTASNIPDVPESFSQETDGTDPYAGQNEDRIPSLPAWYTESESEVVADPEESGTHVDAMSSSWSAAQLNPIYAEDSNRWLSESETIRQEFELTPSDLDSFSPEPLDQETIAIVETEKSEPTYESASEVLYEEPAVDADDRATYSETSYDETRYGEVSFEEAEGMVEDEVADEIKEESIEDYMTRLLQRVKGISDSDAPTTKTSLNASKSRETVASPVINHMQSDRDEPLVFSSHSPVMTPDDVKPGEFAPRQVAPEKAANLAALRNLANDTARQAIHNSSRKKNELVLIGKFAIAVLGFGGAILLLVLNGFRANVAMIGMIASFVVFLLWGYEAVVQFKVLQASKAKEASANKNS